MFQWPLHFTSIRVRCNTHHMVHLPWYNRYNRCCTMVNEPWLYLKHWWFHVFQTQCAYCAVIIARQVCAKSKSSQSLWISFKVIFIRTAIEPIYSWLYKPLVTLRIMILDCVFLDTLYLGSRLVLTWECFRERCHSSFIKLSLCTIAVSWPTFNIRVLTQLL